MNADVDKSMMELRVSVERLDERLQNLCKTSEKRLMIVETALFGNGKTGIKSKVEKHGVYFALLGAAVLIMAAAVARMIFV